MRDEKHVYVLDYSGVDVMCSEIVAHLFSRLRGMKRGERIMVIVNPNQARDLKEAAEMLYDIGLARIIGDVEAEKGRTSIIMERL